MNDNMLEILKDFIPEIVVEDLKHKVDYLEQAYDSDTETNKKLRKALTRIIKAYQDGWLDD